MSMNSRGRRGKEGGAMLWALFACAVLIIAYFVLHKPVPPAPEIVVVAATPAPATPEPATPPPVVQATPTPAPVVMATPPPAPATPPPLDLATVVRTPALWPPQVALVQPVTFPLVFSGRPVGEAKLPAGTILRVARLYGQQVEVEYQSSRNFIPIAATDLMARSLATFRMKDSALPDSSPQPVVAAPATMATPEPKPEPKLAMANAVKIAERIGVEVVRQKRSRIEGGDFDDKKDRIELKIKLSNSDTSLSADKFKGEIFVFGESILDRTAVKMLGSEQFDFSLPPRGNHEFVTGEVVTAYDTTGARFGHKYEGWVLRLRDSAGNIVLSKSSSPTLLRAMENAPNLTKDVTYDRTTLKEKTELR